MSRQPLSPAGPKLLAHPSPALRPLLRSLETRNVNSVFPLTASRAASLLLALSLAGCSSGFLSGDSVDYRSTGIKTAPLTSRPT